MTADGWPTRAGTPVTAENRPATVSRGMVVTNHPLGSAAGPRCWAA
jgi:gamma-glutamyltranspeptidase / glutathione hydrolase